MTKISLSLPHKRRQVILLIFSGLCALIILVSSVLSFLLYKKIKEVSAVLKETQGISLSVKFVCFNPFKGLFIKGLECEQSGDVFLESDHLDVGFDILSLVQHKISIKSIEAARLKVSLGTAAKLLAQEENGAVKTVPQVLDFFETVHFKGRSIWLDEAMEVDLSGYLSFIKQKFFISRGKVVLKQLHIPGVSTIEIFNNDDYSDSFDYAVEMESQNDDLVISRCEFSNSALRFFGEGQIKDYKKQADVSFSLSLSNVMLDNLSFFNNGNLSSRGLFDGTLNVMGPAAALDVSFSGKLMNAQFVLFDTVSLEKVNGSFIFSKSQLTTKDFCLRFNGIQFCSQLDCFFEDHPHILLKLFTANDADISNNFVLNLDGIWKGQNFDGDLDMDFCYASKKTFNKLALVMKSFRFSQKKRLLFSAEEIDASLDIQPLEMVTDVKAFSRDMILESVSSWMSMVDDGIAFNDLKAICYGGELLGDFRVFPGNQVLLAKGRALVNHVDLMRVFEGAKEEDSFLSGYLSGKVDFDSEQAQMFKGKFSIVDGSIEENPLLNSVANFLGVVSLKKVVFDKLVMAFAGGKGDYAAKVRLFSSKVNAILDARIIAYDKIDGDLSVSLATDLLNESKQFSKILKYIKHSEANVVFPFKISSYVDSPRVLWLKNEFKDKLSNLLPESNKRYLQEQLNGMVEKMAEE
ncbi:MAG: hypothetical protein ABIC68_01920 [Candidatus Omnitrophota bacterium]